ncbi:MAG: hypothetical protein AAGD13_02430 [Pseudomonadota bacterium]
MTPPLSQKDVEDLFLKAVRISLDRLSDDPDRPQTAPQIVDQMEALADWRFDIESIKTLLDREGSYPEPTDLQREANALIDRFREADLVDMTRGGLSVLPRGHALIHEHF